MYKGVYTIESNTEIANLVYKMIVRGETGAITMAGQFVNIAIEGFFLRRPISICDYDNDSITLIYKVVGGGTKVLSTYKKDKEIDLLVGLGYGFDVSESTQKPLLIGGGVGVPPLYRLAKDLKEKGIMPSVVLGFSSSVDVFYKKEFEDLLGKDRVVVATIDGSMGVKGLVTDAIKYKSINYDYTFSCGPIPMLRAISELEADGQLSFEERMGCGFGGCMGCTHETKQGYKRICKEGPVLRKSEILWQ